MLIYGASGHARVILSCLTAVGQPVAGVFDDDPARQLVSGQPVIGPYDPAFRPDVPLLIGIGANAIRARLSGQITHAFGRVRHPSAVVDESVTLGAGTVVLQGAVLQVNAVIGQHCIVNTGACIDHDCHIGHFVHIAPNATLCGGVQVGDGSLIGAGSVVLPNLTLGRWVTIAAGAVVTRSVADHATIVGNPGRAVQKP
jgi:sugar O-acyltransferase (sialic acid O-acetyltransferase NeuD family)